MNTNSSHIIIFNEKNEVLLLKRSDDDDWEPGKWSLPGGKREGNETLKQNIVRETMEESGLTIFPDKIRYLPEISKKLNHVFFTTNKFSGKIKLDHENSAAKWIKPEQINDKESVPNLKKEVFAAKSQNSQQITIKISISE